MTTFDLIGLAGVVTILSAYGLTVAGRIDARETRALLANLVGASLVLVSLSHDFNLSAAIVEGAWALIALVGLVRRVARPTSR